MAIIDTRGGGGLQVLLQTLMNKERIAQQQEEMKLRERDLKLREQERQLEISSLQNILQGFAAQHAQGGAFEQQFAAQNPAIQQALQDQTLSPQELQNPQVLAAASGMQAAQAQFAQGQARQRALEGATELARELEDPSILSRTAHAFSLIDAGVPTDIIKDILPEDALARQAEMYRLSGIQEERAADVYATNYLIREGIIPEGVEVIPGARDTLLKLSQSRAEDAIDWMQEGIDFVTARVGDSISGSAFFLDPTAMPEPGISVDQAVKEWKAIVEQMAPEAVAERIVANLDSGMFERRLRVGRATELATTIFRDSMSNLDQARGDVRNILEEDSDLTPSEINLVLNQALARARRLASVGPR